MFNPKKTVITLSVLVSITFSYAKDLVYYDMQDFPRLGTVVQDRSEGYRRIPSELDSVVRKEICDLGKNTAGMAIRFATDASTIGTKWKSLNKFDMNHMTSTGIRGMDLYVLQDDNTWTTVGSARPLLRSHNTETTIITDMEPRMREYMLYLPLYDGVDSIYIGIDSTAVLTKPVVNLPVREKPIVMYGTSIMQGGCANRPGNCHSNILERMLNREIYNFGFSGNAKLDPEVAELISTVDAGMFVIDPLPNLKTPELVERIDKFFTIIRSKHPETPILFVESPMFPLTRFNTETYQTITEKNNALKKYFAEMQDRGEKNIYYFNSENILGDCYEGTVDNYHFTDMGYYYFANNLYPVFVEILSK